MNMRLLWLLVAVAAAADVALYGPDDRPFGVLRAGTTASGKASLTLVDAASVALKPDSSFTLRGPRDVMTTVPTCLVAAAGGRVDLHVALDAAGDVRGLELRPLLPPGFVSCAAAHGAKDVALTVRHVVRSAVEDVPALPAVVPPPPGAARGFPFPGQREVSEADVAAAAGAASLSAEDAAALHTEAAAQLKKDAPQSFFAKYQWYIIGAIVLVNFMQSRAGAGGGGGGEGAQRRPAE